MYVTRVSLQNVRGFQRVEWRLGKAEPTGWHVVIGDNGAGKSTFIRALALALVGAQEAPAFQQDWAQWLRRGADSGRIRAEVRRSQDDGSPDAPRVEKPTPGRSSCEIGFTRSGSEVRLVQPVETPAYAAPTHGAGLTGWFSASYGPFRRFTGGRDYERSLRANPRLMRHMSAFSEAAALTDAIGWLQDLEFQKLEKQSVMQLPLESSVGLLEAIVRFVNQPGFLPHGVRMTDVTSRGVEFRDAGDTIVLVEDLSDGYRSVLSMTFDLIRHLALAFGPERLFTGADVIQVAHSGVVLIDEVDAHLHPTWQTAIGPWFLRHFPKVQFMVTCHSPLVCQAAETGTVWRLSAPGEQTTGEFVTGIALQRLVYGSVLDAYGTGVFGDDVTRSAASRAKLRRLAELNTLWTTGRISTDEDAERRALQAILPTARGTEG